MSDLPITRAIKNSPTMQLLFTSTFPQGEITLMKSIARFSFQALFFCFPVALARSGASAQGKHPAYLHALTEHAAHADARHQEGALGDQ
jgi:hypothetical protein